jgi:hypothetical protein
VEWNLLEKDKKHKWGATTLLAQAIIENGICTYAYSPFLRERLYNPDIYAQINLRLQNKFESGHALALYELFMDYFKVGETPLIPLEKFKELMGLVATEYPDFKELNRRVIKEPIDEINEKSDLSITVEYQKEGTKVVDLKFHIQVKPGSDLAFTLAKIQQKQLPLLKAESSSLQPKPIPLTQGGIMITSLSQASKTQKKTLRNQLVEAGISMSVAQKLVQEYDSERIERQLEAFCYLKANDPYRISKNPSGFLIKSIQENYEEPNGLSERKRWEEQEKETERMLKYFEQRDKEKWQQEEKEQERLDHLFSQLPGETQGEIMEKALQKLQSVFPEISQRYTKQKSTGVPFQEMDDSTQAMVRNSRNQVLQELSRATPTQKALQITRLENRTPSQKGLTPLSEILMSEEFGPGTNWRAKLP